MAILCTVWSVKVPLINLIRLVFSGFKIKLHAYRRYLKCRSYYCFLQHLFSHLIVCLIYRSNFLKEIALSDTDISFHGILPTTINVKQLAMRPLVIRWKIRRKACLIQLQSFLCYDLSIGRRTFAPTILKNHYTCRNRARAC